MGGWVQLDETSVDGGCFADAGKKTGFSPDTGFAIHGK
jgi:hypothetical protein